jgi:hypothetical protein
MAPPGARQAVPVVFRGGLPVFSSAGVAQYTRNYGMAVSQILKRCDGITSRRSDKEAPGIYAYLSGCSYPNPLFYNCQLFTSVQTESPLIDRHLSDQTYPKPYSQLQIRACISFPSYLSPYQHGWI